jgi:serine/threonine protein kinase
MNSVEKTRLIGQGSYSCVYRPAIKCDTNTFDKNPHYISKIAANDKYQVNELAIGKILQKIPHYVEYFAPILESCPANIEQFATVVDTQDCNILQKNTAPTPDASVAAAAFMYNKIKFVGDNDLYEEITAGAATGAAVDAVEADEMYSFLEHSVRLLETAEIIHYDLKSNNIMIHHKTHNPIIVDFGLSIYVPELTRENLREKFYYYSVDYEIWCGEICFICFLLWRRGGERGAAAATAADLDTFMTEWRAVVADETAQSQSRVRPPKQPIFTYFGFSPEEETEYVIEMRAHLEKTFVLGGDASVEDVILGAVREHYRSWDKYSLAVCFQNILRGRGDGGDAAVERKNDIYFWKNNVR